MPELSVIMTTYNEDVSFLQSCVNSICNQTWKDFECIIVLEPEEANLRFLEEVAVTDKRIRIVQNDKKLGVADSRNRAIMKSSSEFIAVMDGDDYYDPMRLEKQLQFLRNNSRISVVGSNMYLIDQFNNIVGERKYPEFHDDIKKNFLLTMSIANPSAMIRRKDLQEIGLFNTELSKAEDFELWLRFLSVDKKLHNLQENLVYYRIQNSQNEKRGAIHWRNNYRARKRYSRFIWTFHERCLSLLLFFVMSHTPQIFLDHLLNLNLAKWIKNIKMRDVV